MKRKIKSFYRVSGPLFRQFDAVAILRHKTAVFPERIGIVVGMFDAVVIRKNEPVDTIKIDDSGIETPEYIVLNPNIPVIPALPTLGNAASYGYAGISPAQTAVIAILEHVIAYRHVAHPGLLEPVIAVALEQNSGPGYMEVIALDNDPSPGAEQEPARPVSRHPATANEDFGIILIGCNQMTFACTFGQRLGKFHFRIVFY